MKNEILYRNYVITYQYGYYWIEGSKMPYEKLTDAKETIDFWLEEQLYCND